LSIGAIQPPFPAVKPSPQQQPPAEESAGKEAEPPSSVIVGNLMWTLTDAHLLEFGRKGHPSAMSATIARLPDMVRSKGWGYVSMPGSHACHGRVPDISQHVRGVFRLITYASLAAAETAIEALNGTELNNRRVHVRIDDNRQVPHLVRRGTPDPAVSDT
jgi:hypothetical protein